jgi:GNAT superfamily N-acetyltransferase
MPISFLHELWLSEGRKADWPYFARWHYRGHGLGPVKRVTLLWHNDTPIGICVFCAPAAALRLRNQFFGRLRVESKNLKLLNRQLWLLARVVVHPTYRGAGIAAAFIRRSCATCPVPWIETLTALGHLNPVFERAGFRRVGVVRKRDRRLSAGTHAGIYGRGRRLSEETVRKCLRSEPVYYVFDNREASTQSGSDYAHQLPESSNKTLGTMG